MSLYTQIRDEIVDARASLSSALRKAKILATSLQQPELLAWLNHELDGYRGGSQLPPYRLLHSPPLGTFSGPFAKVDRFMLPISSFPEGLREEAQELPLVHSVREIEAMVGTAKKDDLLHVWPTEAVMLLRGKISLGGCELIQIHQPITKASLEGILDSVRNRLLDFLLNLQQLSPSIVDSDAAVAAIPHEKVAQAFNITVYGDHNVFAAGLSVDQTVGKEITPGDTAALGQALKGLGVSDLDVRDLETAIKEDGKRSEQSLGKRVTDWIGHMVGKAVAGSWEIALSTAPEVLKEAMFRFYGWK